MPTIYTFMASCRLGYLELDSSGNSGKLLVVLIRVRVTRCTKQASGSYDLLVILRTALSRGGRPLRCGCWVGRVGIGVGDV